MQLLNFEEYSVRPHAGRKQRSDTYRPPTRLGPELPSRILRRIGDPTVSINRQDMKSYKYRMLPRRWVVKIQCTDKEKLRMFQKEGEMRSFSRVSVNLGQWRK